MARWDWYQSTVMVQDPQQSGLVKVLLEAWPLSDWAPAKNLNGYLFGGQIKRGDRTLCHVCWGGQSGVNCKSTSDESSTLADALTKFGKPHLPTRVDSCEDWEQEGLFTSMAATLVQFAQDNRLAINQQGDWVRGESRTLYLGSKDSPVRLVIYEKGYEQGGDAPKDWVRLEVRVRPKREHRVRVAEWTPNEALCAAWIPAALATLGWDHLEKQAVGTVWKRSDAERARSALLKQYGAIIAQWAFEVGSWESFGPVLQDAIATAHRPLGTTANNSTPHTGEKAPTTTAATVVAG